MIDKILEAYLDNFKEDYNLSGLEIPVAFEHFVNHCIITKDYPGNYDFEEIAVGGTHDISIDGLAIMVNDHLVFSEEDIDYFKDEFNRFDIKFIFIQSKLGRKFESSEMGQFLYGVKCFFEDESSSNENVEIGKRRELKDYIYKNAIHMDKPPECLLYYVTTGKWVDEQVLIDRIKRGVQDLKSTKLFQEDEVKFIPIDAEKLSKIYRELNLKVKEEVLFEKHTTLPEMDKVEVAYIGILPAKEYLKLICDKEGSLQRSIFYDNVRDFQGRNHVNKEIEETLRDGTQNDKFALLNNGITIVAKSINPVGDRFTIKDYQVVNGCQTSHILYNNKDIINEKIYIPVKLVVTDDPDVTNEVIKATNRQTEVRLEAFESLKEFQKKLEEFYNTFGKDKKPRLYYERRSKQYGQLKIPKKYIVTLTTQVKSFLAMFLNEPHSTHKYYGELIRSNQNKLFLDNHSLYPYYISSYTLITLESFFSDKAIDNNYKKFKYQMIMLFRFKTEPFIVPHLNNLNKIDKYCDQILKTLFDRKKTLKIFKETTSIIDEVLQKKKITKKITVKKASRLKAFTNELIEYCLGDDEYSSEKILPATVDRVSGTVKNYSDIKGHGFIETDTNKNVYVHSSDLEKSGIEGLVKGQKVIFTIVKNDRGYRAIDLSMVQ
ncbi:MAG: AIPR family protein [Deltaproteobacteria bacterium]|nr:AIPR family protein [Candidatus Zymogenaceae bacterium]